MAKSDLVASINQSLAMRSGEFVTVGAVVQVTQLAMTSPFVGDFQITDAGRLIVGTNVNEGSRVIVTPAGWFGYDANSVQTLAFYAADTSSFGAGDALLGRVSGNYMHFDASAGTLGVYSPAGAGFIAGADGSLYAGDTDGAHMHWSSADHAFQVRNGTDVKISLDANGDGFFDGTVYAQGGRIYGTMAVDGLLRVGDVDGPQIAMGKFSRINDSGLTVETGEIMATDANNLPWFHVVAGGETAGGGYFNLGATGDYAGRMSFDGTTLSVAEWIVDSDALVSPSGYIELNTNTGIRFISPPIDIPTEGVDGTYEDRMISSWNAADDALPTHRISAIKSSSSPVEHTMLIQAQPASGDRARLLFSALGVGAQGNCRFRAVGDYDGPNQQATVIDMWAYREEGGGAFTHRRIDLDTDITRLFAYTGATIPGGTIQNGSLFHSNGTYEPGAGAGVYIYYGGYWVPVALAGDAIGWEAVDNTDDGMTAGNVTFYTCSASGGSFTINLPAATAKPRNWEYTFYKSDSSANTITIDADGAATINGATTYVLTTQHDAVTIRRVGANWNIKSKA